MGIGTFAYLQTEALACLTTKINYVLSPCRDVISATRKTVLGIYTNSRAFT